MKETLVSYEALAGSDLIVDALYLGGSAKNASDDPIAKLVPVGNSGGIRFQGRRAEPRLIALVTSGEDPNWPDSFDPETGVLVYYGDNKRRGRELHDTPRGGNTVLQNLFDASAGPASDRRKIAPILVFTKAGPGRSYRFIGLAVPGTTTTSFSEDLVALWRSDAGLRYQNYRALFTVLDVAIVTREWLNDIAAGDPETSNAPREWLAWRLGASARALRAPRAVEHRSRIEQEPDNEADWQILKTIYDYFQNRPHDFEHFAARMITTYLPDVANLDVTRKSRDGGRDGIGTFQVGKGPGSILLDFSVEAKCYKPGNSVGVRELSRLISRLRHRQFGILVTTSHLDLQAYKELKEDKHPIVVIAGRDIATIVRGTGRFSRSNLSAWLATEFPPEAQAAAPRAAAPQRG